MAGPSYYPLSPIKSPLEGAASSTPGPFSDMVVNDDPPVSLSSKVRTPLRPRILRNGPASIRPPAWRVIKTPLELAILPLVAIAYLAFCYTVHSKAVPVTTYGLYAVTPQHFTAIKGGVTSISIIIISIALFPVYSVISDLQTEEFFRALASYSNGIPLETINNISTPSFGNIEKMMAVWNHGCSNYYILGIVASFFIWVVATLAPGALTINSVLADGGLTAMAVGAVTPQSVLNGSYPQQPTENASLNSESAASIVWAEMELGVQYSFAVANTSDQSGYAAYIVPTPLNLTTTTTARWLSDVIGINPTCSWASTNLTTTLQLPLNSSSQVDYGYLTTVNLPDFDLDVQITTTDLSGLVDVSFAAIKDPTSNVFNHTTQAPPADGSTVFLLGLCTAGCTGSPFISVSIDMSSISNTFTIALTDQTWTMAILTCLPNPTIETHEVRNDGHGTLSVQPLPSGGKLTSQGNLNPIQTTAMFSIVTMGIARSGGGFSGTQSDLSSFGSQALGDVLFGHAQFDSLPGTNVPVGTTATITPLSVEDITTGYTQMIKSASKSYLAGYLGTAYVPGRVSASEIVFAASIPNLVVASVMFALLVALIIIAHFRPGKGAEFTLVNIAAAVHESELPTLFAQQQQQQQGAGLYGHVTDQDPEGISGKALVHRSSDHKTDEHQTVVEALRGRRIFMQRRADGSPVLHISSE